jgi:Tfp pilus assembly protein PilX
MNGGVVMGREHGRGGERGFALVVTLLILLVMSMLGLVLMAGVAMNRDLAGHDPAHARGAQCRRGRRR